MQPPFALRGKFGQRLSHYLPALIVGLCLVSIGVYADYLNRQAKEQELRQSVADQAGAVRANLEGNITSSAMLIKGLVAAISVEPDISQERFVAMSTPLLTGHTQIRNLAAAPDLVVQFVNPIEGNESVLGLDYSKVPEQFDAVKQARDSGNLLLTGPVNLVQGGQGFIVRLPVFTASPNGEEKRFWGIISSVIDVEEFFQASGLHAEDSDIALAIRSLDKHGSVQQEIFGDQALFQDEPVLTTVSLPSGSWQLAAVPQVGWASSMTGVAPLRFALVISAALIMALLLSLGRSMEERSKSKLHMQALMDHSPATIYVKDLQGRYTFINGRFESLHEVKRADVIGSRDTDLFPAEMAANFTEQDRSVVESGHAIEFEEQRSEGDFLRSHIVVKFPLRNASGKTYAVGGISTDISERKRLEIQEAKRHAKGVEYNRVLTELIHEQEYKTGNFRAFLKTFIERISGVLDVVGVRVWELDKKDSDYRLRCLGGWNQGGQDHDPDLLVKQSDCPRYFEALFKNRTIVIDDIRLDPRTSEFTPELFPWIQASALLQAPFYFSGEVAGVLCVERDDAATEWKIEEEAFVISAADILSLALEFSRRSELEKTLRRTEKMDALGKLTGGIAHDCNNLLGVIVGYSEMLSKDLQVGSDSARYANEILRAGERGAKLTRKILGFSRRKGAEAQRLDLNELLQGQQHMLEKTLTARIDLSLDLEELVWPLVLDAGDLEDCVINLSVNAMHAIESAGQLTIRTRNVHLSLLDATKMKLKPGDFVLLEIIDSGKGMDRQTLDRVFEPFFSTKGTQGTGLGLAQVYGFMERSRGAIKILSELGVGTRIQLYFPRSQEHEANPTQGEGQFDAFVGNGESILVVDDEPALLHFTSKVLEENGYRVAAVRDGEQALAILEHQAMDLIISDVIMPGMNGYDLVDIVGQRHPETRVLLVSGFSGRNEFEAESGVASSLLAKPYSATTLLQRVHAQLTE